MFLKSDIEKYFTAEKNESVLFMVMGAIALIAAIIILLSLKTSLARGAAIPLLLVGIIQFIVGWNVYHKSDKQRTDMVYAYDLDPAKLRNEELPRMQAVLKNFVVLRYTEIALLLAGVLLSYAFRTNNELSFWYGFGIALTMQAFISLLLDFFAERRGHIYFNGLESFLK